LHFQYVKYIANRAGALAVCNFPLLWLFTGRNNFLQWVTGWTFSTFNVFHRWIARVVIVEAIIHSACYTVWEGRDGGFAGYASWFEEGLWTIAGVTAASAFGLLLGASVYPLRRMAYEFFLRLHIALSLCALIGVYIHLAGQGDEWVSYLPYIYAAAVFWIFDHAFTVVRLILLNWRVLFGKQERATISYHADHDVMRISVPCSSNFQIQPGAYYFLYFVNSWRAFESHPFTLAAWTAPSGRRAWTGLVEMDPEKLDTRATSPVISNQSTLHGSKCSKFPTLTFLAKPQSGYTANLKKRALSSESNKFQTIVFVEGPYGQRHPLHCYENVVLICAGSGITAVLPYLYFLLSKDGIGSKNVATNKVELVWSVRSEDLAKDILDRELKHASGRSELKIRIHVTGPHKVEPTEHVEWYNGRMNVSEVIEGAEREGRTAVSFCGPGRMADQARMTVVRLSKAGVTGVDYFEDCFGW
jgi:predicted ferric reductase